MKLDADRLAYLAFVAILAVGTPVAAAVTGWSVGQYLVAHAWAATAVYWLCRAFLLLVLWVAVRWLLSTLAR